MSTRWHTLSTFALMIAACNMVAEAQQSYPRVYGPTGQPYGPTQAHYQYQRQYGQPWHGYDGISTSRGISTGTPFLGTTSVYGWNGGMWGGGVYPGFAFGYYGPSVFVPPVAYAPGLSYYGPGVGVQYGYYGVPGVTLPYPNHAIAQQPNLIADPLAAAALENQQRWGNDLPQAKPDPITRPALPSSTEAKLRSLRAQVNGDEQMRKQNWQHAYVEYKKAVEAADDRADAHLRLGIALLTIQHYDTAMIELQRAFHLDPQLPQSGLTLRSLYGDNSDLTINSIISRLTAHAEQDIRDPNRLFLLGMMLHFHGNPQAREILDVGYRLAGRGNHFLVFLQPQAQAVQPNGNPPLPPAPDPQNGNGNGNGNNPVPPLPEAPRPISGIVKQLRIAANPLPGSGPLPLPPAP